MNSDSDRGGDDVRNGVSHVSAASIYTSRGINQDAGSEEVASAMHPMHSVRNQQV
jgi:hypothetical protein